MVSAFFVNGDSEAIVYLLSNYSSKTIKQPTKNQYDSSEIDTNLILKIGQDSFSLLKISSNGRIFLTSASICDNSVKLKLGYKIGEKKSDFIKKLRADQYKICNDLTITGEEDDDYNTVYITFKNDLITSISIWERVD